LRTRPDGTEGSDLPDAGAEPELDEDLLEESPDDEAEPDETEGDEPDPDQEAEPDERQQNQQQDRRSQRRGEVHRARERADAAERRAADVERQLGELRTQIQQRPNDPAAQARAAEEERMRFEQMSPVEIALHVRETERQHTERRLQVMQLGIQNTMDRSAFDAAARNDTVRRDYADRVNRYVESELRQGRFVSRETVYYALLGQDVDSRRQQATQRQQRQGARQVARQTVRPASGRGDVARGGGRQRDQGADDVALLRGTTVGDL
jgi:hypothetical protein